MTLKISRLLHLWGHNITRETSSTNLVEQTRKLARRKADEDK